MDKDLLIRLDSGWPDDLRVLERENIRLRNELEWLDAVGVAQPLSTGDAAKDSKAAEAFDGNSILVTAAASGRARTSLVSVVPAWVQRDRRHSFSVWQGEHILALKGLSPDKRQCALKAFIARCTGAADWEASYAG
jgi:hypothetical protein